MQFNSHATNLDCVSEILKICGATTATYPLVDITRRFNGALDWYTHLAAKAGKRWPFDDINQTTSPIGVQALTAGVNAYKLSAFSGSILYGNKFDILASDGTPKSLEAEEFIEAKFTENYKTSVTGTPDTYTKFGDFIYLKPTPSYTLGSAFRTFGVRPALYMASTDTTKVPGVPVIHHFALCRHAALAFLIENNLPKSAPIAAQLQKDERDILAYFGYRNNDLPSRFKPLTQNNR